MHSWLSGTGGSLQRLLTIKYVLAAGDQHDETRQQTAGKTLPREECMLSLISYRDEHTVAITPEDVISWGANNVGQCGQGERSETTWVKPRSLKPLQGLYVSQVVCGRTHTLCVTATSQVRPDKASAASQPCKAIGRRSPVTWSSSLDQPACGTAAVCLSAVRPCLQS